ncbi:MAG: hypothetical protein IPL78_29855 [Chloroflexi bacterium]|nr:hypothetical protein [Chloroflexota bacterium]
MSFLPMDPNSYPQMPIADVSEQEWEDARAQVQHIDWSTIYDTGIGLDAEGDKFWQQRPLRDTSEIN